MNIKANFEIHYRQNYETIFRFCYRMLGSREVALDITQETFIKLYERMNGQGSDIENTKAWLYKVAGNLCLNELNTKSRHSEIENGLDRNSVENTDPENILIKEEKVKMVRKAIEEMKPEKQLLILMYQDGLSYQEMSEATGIKLNSVGKTLWRIIDNISETIKNQTNA